MPTRLATVSTGAIGGGGASSLTFSHTVDADTDVLLVCVALNGTTPTITGITFNGVGLTQKADASSGGAGSRLDWWYLLSPTPATANVVITLDSAERGGAFAVNYGDVDAAGTPFGGGVTGTGTSVTPTLSVASAIGQVAISGARSSDGDTITATVGAGQSEIANFIGSATAGTNSSRIVGSDEPGAASVTMDYTLSSSAAWRTGGFSILPAPTVALDAHDDFLLFPRWGDQRVVDTY